MVTRHSVAAPSLRRRVARCRARSSLFSVPLRTRNSIHTCMRRPWTGCTRAAPTAISSSEHCLGFQRAMLRTPFKSRALAFSATSQRQRVISVDPDADVLSVSDVGLGGVAARWDRFSDPRGCVARSVHQSGRRHRGLQHSVRVPRLRVSAGVRNQSLARAEFAPVTDSL